MAKVFAAAASIGAGTVATAATVVTAGAAVGSAINQRKAAKSQEKSNDLQQRIQDVRAARERRKLVSQARINAADIQSAGQGAGAGQSSSVFQGAQQQSTQAASGISFLNQVQDLTNQQSVFNQQAASSSSTANIFGAIGGTAKGVAGLFKG